MVAIWIMDNSARTADKLLLDVRSTLCKSPIVVAPQYKGLFVDFVSFGNFFQLLVKILEVRSIVVYCTCHRTRIIPDTESPDTSIYLAYRSTNLKSKTSFT